jgi:hypothetical protein
MKSYNHANHDHMMLHVPFLKRCFAVSHLIMPEVHVIVAEINLTQVHTWICSAQAELSSPFCSRTEGTSCVVKICTRPSHQHLWICWYVWSGLCRTWSTGLKPILIWSRLGCRCFGALAQWFCDLHAPFTKPGMTGPVQPSMTHLLLKGLKKWLVAFVVMGQQPGTPKHVAHECWFPSDGQIGIDPDPSPSHLMVLSHHQPF